MKKYDMHVHSVYSDGSDTPEEIMERAGRLGVKRIALTDHDSIGGLHEAREAASRFGLTFINGIELSVRYEKTRLLHILGLNLDVENKIFLSRYQQYRNQRTAALEKVVVKLKAFGADLRLESLKPHVMSGQMDRQTVAKWLVAEGYAPNITKAWNDFLDKIPYEEGEILEPREAFDMIHAAGGQAYLAHIHKWIGMEGYGAEETKARVQELMRMGLDGIESEYPSFTEIDRAQVRNLVETLGLAESGGSDYHGSFRPDAELGNM